MPAWGVQGACCFADALVCDRTVPAVYRRTGFAIGGVAHSPAVAIADRRFRWPTCLAKNEVDDLGTTVPTTMNGSSVNRSS
jgi:hypothetical protein